MGIAHHYEPCFTSIPESITDRWTLLREFVSRWHNLNVPRLRDPEYAARDIEYALGQPLPYSIREWVAFSCDLIEIGAFEEVLRDEFDVSRMGQFNCTTLMLQGEGDVYWTVADKHSALDDPPVDCLHRDIDTNQWVGGWNEGSSLTSFTLGHMAHFLGRGFVRARCNDDSLICSMQDEFPIAVDFDGLLVFEIRDMIAFVQHQSDDDYTIIAAWKETLPESGIPDCVRRLLRA
ncbi:MAG: hypothetical protein Aurels2KO_45910 [Aureliella sp.]